MTNEHQMAVDAIRRRLERWSKQPVTMNKGEALGALLFLLDIIDTQQELLIGIGQTLAGNTKPLAEIRKTLKRKPST